MTSRQSRLVRFIRDLTERRIPAPTASDPHRTAALRSHANKGKSYPYNSAKRGHTQDKGAR